MKILYKQENGRLAIVNLAEDFDIGQLGTVINNFVPTGVNYAIVDDGVLPTDHEFRDAWVIDDNLLTNSNVDSAVITLNQTIVEEIKRSRFPTLSPAQFELRLLKAGLRQQILDYVATSEELQIVFNRATYFSRTDPFLLEAMQALNLSDTQIDAIWLDEV